MNKKTIVGIVTYGNLPFTKLTAESIIETTKNKFDFIFVVGKPGDWETRNWCANNNYPHIVHDKNYGFPYSINDIYDHSFGFHNADNLIIAGNDIVAYPYAVDSLINLANETDYEAISTTEFNVKDLIKKYPETRQYFIGDTYKIKDFGSKCWNKFTDYSEKINIISDGGLIDLHNLALYKKSVFNKVGYIDVNFFPCLTPDTLILNSKLDWVTLDSIKEGEELIGVEEYPSANKLSRKYKPSIVEKKIYKVAECLKITLEDGREITCSKNHRWLAKHPVSEGYKWIEAAKLKEKYRICSPLKTWNRSTTFDAGW